MWLCLCFPLCTGYCNAPGPLRHSLKADTETHPPSSRSHTALWPPRARVPPWPSSCTVLGRWESFHSQLADNRACSCAHPSLLHTRNTVNKGRSPGTRHI
uniref:Putative secreted protein n=1 Tax=Ixodes ricinus TaxID=34613 RepID=A0A6B0UEM6_IXORI